MNFFNFSDDNKRYHTLYFHNRHTYGMRIGKAVIDAGFGCPNKDGTKGKGGCIFCSGGSGYFTSRDAGDELSASVRKQLENESKRIYKKFGEIPITAYFQAGTNTYADIETLRKVYGAALDFGVKQITIGTRADCLADDVLDLLSELSDKTEIRVELGLQTVNDRTAKIINRGYEYYEFLDGYKKLKSRNIPVCVHIINGLPGESCDDMLKTAKDVGKLCPDGIKIHLLHVIRDTVLHRMYEEGSYVPMERDDYIETVVRQLELIPPETVIERLTGDGDRRTLVAPMWSRDKIYILGMIDKRMAELDTWQGKNYRL